MDEQLELISVVIPSYNRVDTIIPCVESVLNQTYNNIEVIVVDDGSQDATQDIFRDFYDQRVKYVKYSPNRGACYARNYGVKLSRGTYIAFQDSDDEWFPEKLEKQLTYMKKTGADFVFCGMNRKDPIGNTNYYYPELSFDDEKDVLQQLLTNNVISTQTIMVRREMFDTIEFDVTFKRYQDWDFSLQAAIHGYKIRYYEKALVNSTVQKNSISATVKAGEGYEHLFRKYKDIYSKYPNALASICNKIGHGYRKTNRKKTLQYFALSLKYKFDGKILIKIVLYSIGLWR